MIGRVWAIALNTFREAIRNKVLYGIAVVVVGVIFGALVLGQMSLHEEARVARDFGLAGVSLFGSLTAIVLGVMLLYTELQKKTVHTILAKPIYRAEFVVGKYLGMAISLTLLTLLFAAALKAMLSVQGTPMDVRIVKALALAYCEVLVVAALAVFFSSFSSWFLSGVFAAGMWVLGRWSDEMQYAAANAKDETIKWVAKVGLWFVPDLHRLSISGSEIDGQAVSVHGAFVTWGYVGTASAYALAWIVLLLALATVSFSRRDFV